MCQKRAVKRKKENCVDKDWADKHATRHQGSQYEQQEFKEGQDLEEVVIDGFLKPYEGFIKGYAWQQ